MILIAFNRAAFWNMRHKQHFNQAKVQPPNVRVHLDVISLWKHPKLDKRIPHLQKCIHNLTKSTLYMAWNELYIRFI